MCGPVRSLRILLKHLDMVSLTSTEQEILRNINYEQQQQRLQFKQQQHSTLATTSSTTTTQAVDYSCFDITGPSDVAGPFGQANLSRNGFTHLIGSIAAMSPSLALGGSFDNYMYHIQYQHQQQPQQEHNQHHHLQQLMQHELLVHRQPQPQQPHLQSHHEDRNEEGPSRNDI